MFVQAIRWLIFTHIDKINDMLTFGGIGPLNLLDNFIFHRSKNIFFHFYCTFLHTESSVYDISYAVLSHVKALGLICSQKW